MTELPLNSGHCKWVAARLERELTDIEKELVTILCSALGVGPWNVHRNWSIMKECGYPYVVLQLIVKPEIFRLKHSENRYIHGMYISMLTKGLDRAQELQYIGLLCKGSHKSFNHIMQCL